MMLGLGERGISLQSGGLGDFVTCRCLCVLATRSADWVLGVLREATACWHVEDTLYNTYP